MAAIPLRDEVYYPESDGQPMGETEIHIDEILDLLAMLKRRYREAADVYVGADMLLYYVQGDPRRRICPDVFVTFGIPKQPKRRSYFVWKEGRPPSMVIEVTSEGSRREDQEKKVLYARLGVEEYFLHDPLGEYLKPSLQGYRLVGGEYRAIRPAADGSLASEVAGLLLRQEGGRLRLIDAATREPLLWRDEQDAAFDAVKEENARLRRELERRGR